MIFQTIYNYDRKAAEDCSLLTTLPTMAQQQFKEESDINNIIARYKTTGLLTDPMNPGTVQPMFGDFTTVPTLQEAQNQIIEATQLFEDLPATLRRRFGNDPLELLDFVQNEENREEAIKLGLLPAPPPEPVTFSPSPIGSDGSASPAPTQDAASETS